MRPVHQHSRARTDDRPAQQDLPVLTDASGELVAGSLSDYLRSGLNRIRHGESGMLPILAGLVVIVIIFQTQQSLFLSAGNLTNLLVQSAAYAMLGMAEVFVLLLGEMDLSAGYTMGIGAVIAVSLTSTAGHNLPWWLGILAGLAATTIIGMLNGLLVTRLHLPSFIVTLAGMLGWEGALIWMVNNIGGGLGGTISITNHVLWEIVNGDLSPAVGWIATAAGVAAFGVVVFHRDHRRRANGLAAPPVSITIAKVTVMAAAGVVLVLVCNANRGTSTVPLRGMPWVLPLVVIVLAGWTFLLTRTTYGRHVFAIGGNAEAARRAGINLARVRLIGFMLCSLTAGIAGLIYASRLGSISNNVDSTWAMLAIAAAVIGGTSLFGGRGRPLHAVVGGLIIGTIYNGMGLLGLSAAVQYMVTALVLLAAVIVDVVARRGATPA